MATQNSRYNNIFNKKNIELTLDGRENKLPYALTSDVELKANQIIFTSINNIFQRLLDNDLYNEAILKKYIENGLIGGPTYVSSLNIVEDSAFLNKKYVVSGENGISVLRKEEKDVSDTLSGRFLDGNKVNHVTSINQRYVACTKNGIYESLDKTNWTRKTGNDGIDVVGMTYNYNFLGNNVISSYDYIAVANSGKNAVFYGHDGTTGSWQDFSSSPELSDIRIENVVAANVFSFDNDANLYVGTKAKGLFASKLETVSDEFIAELGTPKWSVYDMAEIPDTDDYENYLLATNYGLKQSRKKYGFGNLKKRTASVACVYDAFKDRRTIYIAMSEGLKRINPNGAISTVAAFRNIPCYSIAKANNLLYIGTNNGVYSLANATAKHIGLEGLQIQKIASFGDTIFAYVASTREIQYSKRNSIFEQLVLDPTFDDDEYLKQFLQRNNVLYIVTNKRVYAILDGSAKEVFVLKNSFAENNNVYFAKNFEDNTLIAQVDNNIWAFYGNGEIRGAELPEEQTISDAIIDNANNVYFLLNGVLYRLDETNTLETIVVGDSEVTAKKIAFFYETNEYNGISLISNDADLMFLQESEPDNWTVETIEPDSFKDVTAYRDSIYGLSKNGRSVAKFATKSQLAAEKVEDIENGDGVELKEFTDDFGVVIDKTPMANAFLTVLSDSIDLEIETENDPLEVKIENAFVDAPPIVAGDFVGYLNNENRKKTILVGMNDDKVSAFSFGIGAELTAVENPVELTIHNPPQKPKAFADFYNIDKNTNTVVEAMNFVGTNNGLYYIRTKEDFLDERIPNAISSINDVAQVSEEKRIVATNSGIYLFDATFPENFIEAGSDLQTNAFSKKNDTLFASSVGQNVLLSSAIENGELAGWNPVFQSDSNDEFLLDDAPLSSNYGGVLDVNRQTVSFESDSVSWTSILDNPIQCIPTNAPPHFLESLSSLYYENGKIKAGDLYGRVFNLKSFGTSGGSLTCSVELLAGEVPKKVPAILTGKLANYLPINTALSIAEDPSYVEAELFNGYSLTTFDSVENELEDSAELTSLDTDASIQLFDEHATVDTLNQYVQLSCDSELQQLSLVVDFENSEGIAAVTAVPVIQLSSTFLRPIYQLSPVMTWDADAEAYVPRIYDGDEPLSVRNPDTDEVVVVILQGQALSTMEETGKDPLLSVCVLSGEFYLDSANTQCILTDSDGTFAEKIMRYPVAGGQDFSFEAFVSFKDIEYEAGHSAANSSLSVGYGVSADIEIPTIFAKELPYIQETNDGVYYDNAFLSTENDGKLDYVGYALSTSVANAEKLVYFVDANGNPSLYVFDGFNVNVKPERIGLVQIASTPLNDSFDDLYYFRTESNYSEFPIRKTLLGTHDKDFLTAKSSTVHGDISRLAFEENAVYVVKDDALYFTNQADFPNFSKIANSIDAADSCGTYTLAKSGSQLSAFVNGQSDGSFTLTAGTFGNFFHDDSNVYLKTSTGIWQPQKSGGTWTLTRVSDFTKRNNVKAFFDDSTKRYSEVVIGDAYMYAKEKFYDFSGVGYTRINQQTYNVVDLKALYADSDNPLLYIATKNAIIQYEFFDFSENPPRYNVETLTTGFSPAFTDIKSIYFAKRNEFYDLYVLNGSDLYIFSKFSKDRRLTDYVPIINRNFLPGIDSGAKVTMNSFKSWLPAIVKNDSVNATTNVRRFAKDVERTIESGSAERLVANRYLYSDGSLNRLSTNADDSDFAVQFIGNYENGTIDGSGPMTVQENETSIDLWGTKTKEIVDISLSAETSESTTTFYTVLGDVEINSLFFIDNEIRAGMSGRNSGVYGLDVRTGYLIDENNAVSEKAEELLQQGSELFALAFANNGDFLLNYTQSISDEEGGSAIMSLFASNNETLETAMNDGYVSNSGACVLSYLFNRYFFVSDGNDGYIYDTYRKTGEEIDMSQMDRAGGGLASLMFLKDSYGTGLLGYGSAFCTFDSFADIKSYGDVDNKKYIALANNFKRGTQCIKVLNDNPDFLIGTTYGLKYVYDNVMTKSFYDKNNSVAINSEVDAIEKVTAADNDEFFIVGSGNSLFEVTGLKTSKFRKIHEFEPGEIVLDLFALQKNEYLIATTNGLYATSLSYNITNDLQRFTIDNIYEIVNEELQKIIANHIASAHGPSSIVTKINGKASNELQFLSNEDKHEELYDSSIANSIRIVQNDIIDTIVRGGETPESDSYVKVAVKNWALNNIQTKATYANDGFVNEFVDPTSGKTFDISVVPYIVKNWKSGLKEIYIYVPSTGTYYANNPQGISNSQYSYNAQSRANVPNTSLVNTLPNACTTLRVYLYNSYFKIKTIIAAQCTGNSLPLKIYKDNVNADDAWKGVFDTVIQPSALRTLPMTIDASVNNVRNCTDDLERIYLDFSIYGTDAQAIRIIAES